MNSCDCVGVAVSVMMSSNESADVVVAIVCCHISPDQIDIPLCFL